jgi:uncharacterized damage-inducible protein DinB
MKFLLIFLTGSLLYANAAWAQSADSLFIKAAITKLQHAKEYTLKVANLMPGEKFSYKPSPEEMSFGEQLLHISANMGWLCSAYLDGAENPVTALDKKATKKEDIIAVVTRVYEYSINVLQHFDVKQLSAKVSFFAGPMNKLQIINLPNDHQTHHRGQLLVYLRLNGIKPPDYVGW